MRKCKICEERYEPKYTSFQKTCNEVACILAWGKKQKEKEQVAKAREKRRKARDNDKPFWIKKTQTLFNRYIRERDRGKPCISCGRVMTGQIHAGHYRSVGGHPELRFEELNCHAQCAQCNNWKSGNLTEYRSNLIKKIGLEKVEWLEGPHARKQYSIADLREIYDAVKVNLNGNNNPPRKSP